MAKVGRPIKDRTGETHTTNQGYPIRIIKCIDSHHCTIQFEDGITLDVMTHNVLNGGVENPYHRTIYGVGYRGIGRHKSNEVGGKKITKMYNAWTSMLERCYSEEYHKKFPTYIGCSVDYRWHCFQDFGDWFEEHYHSEYMQKWHLDKDILVNGNKIYSPDNCRLVPRIINMLITNKPRSKSGLPRGVYKEGDKYSAKIYTNKKSKRIGLYLTIQEASNAYNIVKKEWIIEVAEAWKALIAEDIYLSLINYNVK